MTAQHTPGPWQYHVTVDGDAIVAGGGKVRVAEALVCDVGYEDERANARLIAAAPDLLAACEAMIGTAKKAGMNVSAFRAAIAKAKGEPTWR